MDCETVRELLHIQGWLDIADEIVRDGQDAHDRYELRPEAADSLMMKIGEASNRLSRAGFVAPKGVEWANAVTNRNWLTHP